MDDKPSHGEDPESSAYAKRLKDAVPDEVEILPQGTLSKRSSTLFLEPPLTPGGSAIPRTVVEKVDPSSPSHGDVPGTAAYKQRLADAAPDVVLKAPEPGRTSSLLASPFESDSVDEEGKTQVPIPETIVTRVDSNPAHGEEEGTVAYDMRRQNAIPDVLEHDRDPTGMY